MVGVFSPNIFYREQGKDTELCGSSIPSGAFPCTGECDWLSADCRISIPPGQAREVGLIRLPWFFAAQFHFQMQQDCCIIKAHDCRNTSPLLHRR